MTMGLFNAVAVYGRMIKFSHSVFALPFAFSGAALAAVHNGITLAQVGWLALAMVGARSAAMGFNRLVDRQIDAANPRTQNRELPRAMVSPQAVTFFVVLSSALFILAAYRLNPLCLYLSPLVLAVLLFYSLTKRFTWASHLVLGLSLGGAPLGAWIAVSGTFDLVPVLLGAAVLTWVAGFDIIYACQDYDFDVETELHSIPVRFGVQRALHLARVLHVLAVGLWAVVGAMMGLNAIYFVGVVVVAALLVYEHRLVGGGDMAKVGMAFQTVNSIISVLYLAFIVADLLIFGKGIGQL
jgi:4-hydroxybenzoate polyprenyltransferase